MRAQGVEKFGESYTAQRRVLAHREEFIRGAFSTENCLNCGEVLRGQHCSHCGQRAKVRVLSLGTLLRDLLGDITNFDSRIWRTLKPLAFSPGTLTVEYLRGRRTHYSPPFRMYLILSVAFFLLTTVGGNPADVLNFEVGNDGSGGANLTLGPGEQAPPAPDTADSKGAPAPAAAKSPTDAPKLDPQRQRIVDEIVKRIPDPADRAKARADLEQDFGAMTPATGCADQSGSWTIPAARTTSSSTSGSASRPKTGRATPAARSWPTARASGGPCTRTSRR